MDVISTIILSILGVDTIRALVAMLGWVKPESKISWIIYGRYDRNLMKSAFKDLGFDEEKTTKIIMNMTKIAKEIPLKSGVSAPDAICKLAILLANYTDKFSNQIQYGGSSSVQSSFYVNTMEASHNTTDLDSLAAIMSFLICKNFNKKPDVIIAPKNGNPLFAQAVAKILNAQLIIAKSEDDNSSINVSLENNTTEFFRTNYEGSWQVIEKKKKNMSCIILDCNTSSGSQLINIIREIKTLNDNGLNIIRKPDKAFVLFRADNHAENIDEVFSSYQCKLFRFFDLDENMKDMLYNIKSDCVDHGNAKVSFYNSDHKNEIMKFVEKLQKDSKLYY